MKGAIFDLDGTIANTAFLHKKAWELALKELGISTNVKIEYLLGRKTSEIAKILANEKWEELMNVKNKIYLQLVDNEAEATECSRELFKELKSKNVKIAIVTSSNRISATKVLSKIGLNYDVLVSGDDVKLGKPNPEGVLKALNELRVEPEKVIGVGDTDVDVTAYYNAGIKKIFLVESGVPYDKGKVLMMGAVIIKSLCDLLQLTY